MQMKRRQFLGFLSGAAVAGPKVAQAAAQATLSKGSLMSEMAGMMGPSSPGYYGEVTSIDGDWKATRITQLKKFLSGVDPEIKRSEQRWRYQALESRDRARIDSLRSVSFVNKMRMCQEASLERDERQRRQNYRWELADLLKG